MEDRQLGSLKIALVHDWLVSQRGGENVLSALCEIFPKADVYTLLHIKGTTNQIIEGRCPKQSWLGQLPNIQKIYRHLLPLMPFAIRSLDLSGYDLVISSSHCVAKGVRVPKSVPHISYIHAPMRYMWDRFNEYFSKDRAKLMVRLVATMIRPFMQRWDILSAKGVSLFIANSGFIASKVEQYYGRKAQVVYPFCDTSRFTVNLQKREQASKAGSYLIVSALVPYKRIDLAINAVKKSGGNLIVVGDGPDLNRLKKLAGSETTFVGSASGPELINHYSTAKALLFPGIEDFGIVPLEAMACGAPVIAFGQGGACETIIDGKTGVFFYENTAESMVDAMNKLESKGIDPMDCHKRAQEFSKDKFKESFMNCLNKQLKNESFA